ncbi:MAG: DegT/DnrJ/EryC1/StrS family aminotransferase [Bacteroidota bacterium]
MSDEIIPFHQPWFTDAERQAVLDVLESGWLATGARTADFEAAVADYVGVPTSAGVSSCTAGLFIALKALGIGSGDEVLVPTITFSSTANVVIHCGAKPVLVDVLPDTLNIDIESAANHLSDRVRAIMPVHVAGHPCDMHTLVHFAETHDLAIIEDCAHALEASYRDQPVGTFGFAGSFSFYPNKNVTAGEGGMLVSANEQIDERFRLLRNHGLTLDSFEREKTGFRQYDIALPGYKLNMNDLQAALGLAQFGRVDDMHAARKRLVARYTEAFADMEGVSSVQPLPDTESGHHLFILQVDPQMLRISKTELMDRIIARGVRLSLHFKPIHLFSYYHSIGYRRGALPMAESAFERIFSLPLFPKMTDAQQTRVIEVVREEIENAKR